MAALGSLIAALVTAASALAQTATSAPPAEAPAPSDWLSAQVNERGQRCVRLAEQQEGARLHVACGPAGVWIFDTSGPQPRFVRSVEFPGDAVGFFSEADGRLWVKLQVLEARPLSSAALSSPASAAVPRFPEPAPESAAHAVTPAVPAMSPAPAPSAVSAGKKTGRVLRTGPGEVVISLGSLDGVSRNDRIEFSSEPPGEDEDDAALSRQSLAVGVVTHVGERSAKVRLGINERVPLDALATPTATQATASLSAPPRVGDVWSLDVTARPFAALDELGAGILLSAAIGRRFASNFHLRAVLDPLAYANVKDKRSVKAVNAALLASYDSQYFEMGLGVGGQTVNDTEFFLSPGSGLAVAQFIRLGALDGLNITARTSVVLFHSQFDFGGMVGNMQIPVGRGYWLMLGGGGGTVGYGYGEFGLRALLQGNGHAGSRFLTVTAGGAAAFKSGSCEVFSACTESLSYGGPMAGVGYEARF